MSFFFPERMLDEAAEVCVNTNAKMARAVAASAVALMAATMALPVQAFVVPGWGNWETTLQGRDLDGDVANGYEAYYDTTLNITWLTDANFAYTSNYSYGVGLNWDQAMSWAANLNVHGVTGWRLPDVKPVNGTSLNDNFSADGSTDFGYNITSTQSELAHLYYVALGNKGYYDTAGNAQPDFGLVNTGPFRNLQFNPGSWSGVEYASNSREAWFLSTDYGIQRDLYKGNVMSAWAVHSGDIGTVPEPQAVASALAGLAVAAVAARWRHR